MAQASILGSYAADQAEVEHSHRPKGPLTFLGMALAVFVGNVLTGTVAGVVYWLITH